MLSGLSSQVLQHVSRWLFAGEHFHLEGCNQSLKHALDQPQAWQTVAFRHSPVPKTLLESKLSFCTRVLVTPGVCPAFSSLDFLVRCVNLTHVTLSWDDEMLDIGPVGALKNLEYLNIRTCFNIESLAPLTNCPALTALDAGGYVEIKDISALANCHALQKLTLSAEDLDNIDPIGNLHELRTLSLDLQYLQDISPVGNCHQLESLTLSAEKVQNLSPLEGCPNLRSVSLQGMGITDLDGLAKCIHIEDISLGCFRDLTDMSVLGRFPKLRYVRLANTLVQRIDALQRCGGLQYLHIVRTRIPNTDGLRHYTQLKVLHLGDCINLQSLEPLRHLPQLEDLCISKCLQLQDISAVAGCKRLRTLDLAQCWRLSDICPLAECTQMVSLRLTHAEKLIRADALGYCRHIKSLTLNRCTSLRNVQFLTEMPELESLNFEYCRNLQDFQPLANNRNLRTLYLNYTRIRSLSIFSSAKHLELISLAGCEALADIGTLISHASLQEVNLSGCIALTDFRVLRDCPALTYLQLDKLNMPNVEDLRNCNNLTHLCVSDCPLLRQVNALASCPKLGVLFCKRSPIPADNISRLKSALPSLRVYAGP